MQQILGLDVGGANIKAADSAGRSISIPFALWKTPLQLSQCISERVLETFDLDPFHRSSKNQDRTLCAIALTMTGELCDCFATKLDGVKSIINSVCNCFPTQQVFIYSTDGDFLSPESATCSPKKVAASNWHALAKYCTQLVDLPGNNPQDYAMLIDIGSTSTDIIPLNADHILALGKTDTTRIANHELVYTGALRSPVCAVSDRVVFRGSEVSLAHEFFATKQDVCVVKEWLPEDDRFCETADGRPATIQNAKRRLARMLCAELNEIEDNELINIAGQLITQQLSMIQSAVAYQELRFGKPASQWIVSGSGGFLIEQLAIETGGKISVVHLNEVLGEELSSSGPAYAVAKLLESHRNSSPMTCTQ